MQKFDMDTVDIPTSNGGSKFRYVPNGGYVCYITKVTDNPKGEYLEIEYEIGEGEYEGFAAETMERAGFCPLRFNRYHGEKSRGYFKKFTKDIESSNPGYKWDWNEQSLVHKYIGVVIQEQEKVNAKGYTNVYAKVDTTCSVGDIKAGNFKVPERLKAASSVTLTEIPATDNSGLPF